MELPAAVVVGALATLGSGLIAACVALYSSRTTKDLGLAKLQAERDQSSTNNWRDLFNAVTADVDKKQSQIDALESQNKALQEELNQWRFRCLRHGEPCSGLPLTLPGQQPYRVPPPPTQQQQRGNPPPGVDPEKGG